MTKTHDDYLVSEVLSHKALAEANYDLETAYIIINAMLPSPSKVSKLRTIILRLQENMREIRDTLALAHDTIRIALKSAGHTNVDKMTQFDRASALLDMAQEFKALSNMRRCDADCQNCQDELCGNYKEGAD